MEIDGGNQVLTVEEWEVTDDQGVGTRMIHMEID